MIPSIEQGRKEDGNRSIADKIIKRFHEIEMTVENNHGRWVWELLQNAKDSVADSDKKVTVEIELGVDCVVFRHNGTHFSEKDIRGLVNQITSKELEEGEERKRTGKFGTGFLTTHLLSKVVEVEGIVETVNTDFFSFSFPLDRNGKTTSQLVPRIENAWKAFHESTEDNQISNYARNDFNTSFTYNLETKEQHKIARIGVDEFIQLIPIVLSFIPTIESVKIIDNICATKTEFENSVELEDDVLLSISKTENNKKSKIKLLLIKEDDVAIAAIVEETAKGCLIKDLKDFPKLFCDFPLVGTENFHFPVIVNSFYFNPLLERDGVWLKGDGKEEVEVNRDIFKKTVDLYGKLLDKITEFDFGNYYNICLSKTPSVNGKYFDDKWYQNNIQTSLREIITKAKVIETDQDKVLFSDTRFPDPGLKKDDRGKIWQFSKDLKVNTLPLKKHIHKWADLIWKGCSIVDIASLVEDIEGKSNLNELINTLDTNENKAIIWLNNCIEFIYETSGQKYFNDNELIPNQDGLFKKRKELAKDEIGDESLKEIASLLGYNYYEKLIHEDIYFEDNNSVVTLQDAALEITKLIIDRDRNKQSNKCTINSQLKTPDGKIVFNKGDVCRISTFDETDNTYSIFSPDGNSYSVKSKYVELLTEDKITAIRKLCEWFDFNEKKAKLYFSDLYRKKEKLFVDTIEDKENLYRVLKTKTPLSKLAEVAKAIENDPEILEIIARRQREREEELERNEVGEKVEKVLAEALQQQGFKVKKVIFGKDLVITLKKKDFKYSIEVKSTSRESYVSMTPFQAKTSVNEAKNYALCVVQKNGLVVTKDYIRQNAKFVVNIGVKLHDKVKEVIEFENNKTEIANTDEDIDLFYENDLEYKYKISSNIWTKGQNFWDFVNYLKEL